MSSEDAAYLNDMLDAARRATSYVSDMTLEAFEADQRTQDAVLYRLGVLGEAAKFVSPATADGIAIDWTAIRGMRNRIFHGYRDVKLDIVWTTVVDHLPTLIAALERANR